MWYKVSETLQKGHLDFSSLRFAGEHFARLVGGMRHSVKEMITRSIDNKN